MDNLHINPNDNVLFSEPLLNTPNLLQNLPQKPPQQLSFEQIPDFVPIVTSYQYLEQEIIPTTQLILKEFSTSSDFEHQIQLAFGYGCNLELAHKLINHLADNQLIPNIEIIPQSQLQADGAFGNNTIYLSQDLVNPKNSNSSQAVNILLEEIGHYIDDKINIIDAVGDEGELFAAVVQNQVVAPESIAALKAENDHSFLELKGEKFAVEHAETPGIFLVDNTGKISINFLADAGSYRSEMAIFSLQGIDNFTPGSGDYIKEAARRALSNSPLGYIVIIDPNEGAKFTGELGENNQNEGNYSGIKTFDFTPGSQIAMMLVPQGTVQQVFDNPNVGNNQRPLFSIAAANPNNATQMGQLVPGTFGWEDIRVDQNTDADYNDIIFQIKGATGTTTEVGQLFAVGKDWRNLPLGQEIITFASIGLIAKLAQDTGIVDSVTNNPEIVGSLNNASNISKLQARLGGSNFADILSELKPDGNFVLNKNKLAQINGGQLADGEYQLTLRAENQGGNVDEFLVKFTLDNTKPGIPTEIGLKNDSDTVTNQNKPTITGKGETGALIEILDGQNKLGQTIVVNGFWEITTSQITDGLKNLTITATDIAGNKSDAGTKEFTIDSALPQINITNPQANAQLTTGARLQGTVNGTGSIIDKLTYRFGDGSEINVPVNAQGAFDVELNLTGLSSGQQNLIIKAIDLAGNSTEKTQVVVINSNITSALTPGFMLDTKFDSAPIGDSYTTFDKVNLIGQTEANATVTLQGIGTSIIADNAGKFTFTDVPLILGDNSFTVNAQDIAGNTSTFTTIIKRVEQDNGDVVLDWNATLLNAIYEDKTTPPVASRNMAITQTAVFDAINTITGTYKNYHFTGTAPTIVSAEAAAASAAHQVLINLYPGQKSYFDNALTASLAEITDGTAEDNGVTFGRTVADAILTFRSGDGSSSTITYTPGTNPGQWQPTSPGFASALLPQWGQVTPFALTSGDQFRPDGTPALNSAEYTTEFNQVKDLGSKNSTNRTTEQTQIAKFWADGSGTFTPPGHWNQIAQNVAATKGNSLVDNARLFALLDISLADAGIAAWDAKYNYNFWRPITAIQNADSDGNADTIADASWTPLLTTPPFPEYVSGHSTFSGAAETILTGLLGNNVSFTTNSLGTPGIYRTFSNFTNAANEAGISRIYGGIHFNSANVEGLATGRSVGNYVLENLLAPKDNIPPTVAISSTPSTATSFVELTFNEPVQDSSFTADKYSLVISGGVNDGQAVTISSVEKLSSTLVRLNLAAAFTTGNYKLTVASGLTDIAGNATTTAQNFDLNIAAAPLEISPNNGEEMVGLNRETVVRFGKKIDPTTVKDDSFYLIANGQRIAGNIKVSSTEEFATFFYANPLPASTEVRVVVDGSKIIGRDGVAIDGNLDGVAGGIATADFTTLPITRIQGTDVWGYVYDSYNKNPDGSNIPIKGVTIRLDALPDVFAVTDDKGYFILEDVPAPDFYVYIDGSTATGAPAATQYASLGKPFHSVPGQSTQLFMDGLPFDVYLPPMAASDVKPLSTTEDTQVGFGEVSQAFLQQLFPDVDPDVWTQVQVTFVAGSAQDDGGNVATQAMIIPVDPQRLPAPLPPGVDPQLVISIQAGGANGFNREADGGATNFDVPAPIQFPNLEGLQPGEKSLFWSFDHDAGKWIVIGTGTVSEDGKTIKSDPGVGVLAPGWHFTQPGVQHGGNASSPPDGEPEDEEDVTFEAGYSFNEVFTPLVVSAKFGFQLPTSLFKNIDPNDENTYQPLLWDPEFKLPKEGVKFGTSPSFTFTVDKTVAKYVPEFNLTLYDAVGQLGVKGQLKAQASIKGTGFNPIGKIGGTLAANVVFTASGQIQDSPVCNIPFGVGNFVCKEISFEVPLFGSPTISIPEVSYPFASTPIIDFNETIGPIAELFVGSEIKMSPTVFIRRKQTKALLPFSFQNNNLELENTNLTITNTELSLSKLTTINNDPRSYYRYILSNGFEIAGRTDKNGNFNTILPPNTEFSLFIYSPLTNRTEIVSGKSGISGTSEQINVILSQIGGPDKDGDSIPDFGELTIGTNFEKADTNGDGISDLAAIQQGLDPLGGQGFPTGIISSLPLQGEAKAVVVEGSTTNSQTQTAYVATGDYGLAVVNASQFNNPIILGQLNLPGDATDVAVDTRLNIAAVASNSGGLQLVNVADGMLPTLNKTLNLNANQVEIADGIAYATVDNMLHAIDLVTGEELQQLTLPGSGTVTGLAREGTKLYAFVSGSDTFSAIDITDEGAARVLGQLNVDIASPDVGLSVGNGIAYLAGSGLRTIDISDLNSPKLIGDAAQFFTARNISLNGSGLALVSAEDQGLAVYNSTDPQKTDALLTVIDTPGFAYNAAIASGIAFVADGSSGLQVINYLPFDNKGQAPTINISTSAIDLDPNTDGIQLEEGSTIPIRADILDDVQVRNVELLVNGQVVTNDVSFPWDVSVIAPAITPEKNTADIQVRVTDTGGNTVLSNTLTLNLSENKFAPIVLETTPNEGERRKEIPSIGIRFNEALDPTKLNLSGITLTNLGADGVLGGGDDFVTTVNALQTRNFDRTLVIFPNSELPKGNYQLKIDPSIIADRVGNNPTNPITLNFTQISTPLSFGTVITGSLVQEGDEEVYTFRGQVGQRLLFDRLYNGFNGVFAKLESPTGVTLNFGYSGDSRPFTLTETGTYRLTVVKVSSDNSSSGYSFRLLDTSVAPTITLGKTVSDTITSAFEADIYQINGTAGQNLYFQFPEISSGPTMTLYGSENQYISGSIYEFVETTLQSDGTYLLVITGNSTNETPSYSFKVDDFSITTTPLTLGNIVSSTIDKPGEIDQYSFTGTAGQILYYDALIDKTPDNTTFVFPSIFARLISPSGKMQTAFKSGDADGDRYPFTLTETGTYRLVIDGDSDKTGNYSFRLLDASTAPTIDVGTTVIDTLTLGLEADVYRINGKAGQRLFLNSLVTGSVNANWTLFDSTNQILADNHLSTDLIATLSSNGTYLLVIRGTNSDGIVNYSFRLPAELTLGTTVTNTISQPGEIDEYTFTATAGQRLYYDGLINKNTSNIFIQLITPTAIFSPQNANNDFLLSSLQDTGTYKLLVSASEDSTGSYSFRLLDESTTPILTLDTTVTDTLTPGLEADVYRINGKAGQKLFFDSLATASGAIWTLYGPGIQYVGGFISISNDFEVTLASDGTYLLVLDGNNSNGNIDYSFKVR